MSRKNRKNSSKQNNQRVLPSYSFFNNRQVSLKGLFPKVVPPKPDWMSLSLNFRQEAENTATEEQITLIADAIRTLLKPKQEKLLRNLPKLTAEVQKKEVPNYLGLTSFSEVMRCGDFRKRNDIVGKVTTALWEI